MRHYEPASFVVKHANLVAQKHAIAVLSPESSRRGAATLRPTRNLEKLPTPSVGAVSAARQRNQGAHLTPGHLKLAAKFINVAHSISDILGLAGDFGSAGDTEHGNGLRLISPVAFLFRQTLRFGNVQAIGMNVAFTGFFGSHLMFSTGIAKMLR